MCRLHFVADRMDLKTQVNRLYVCVPLMVAASLFPLDVLAVMPIFSILALLSSLLWVVAGMVDVVVGSAAKTVRSRLCSRTIASCPSQAAACWLVVRQGCGSGARRRENEAQCVLVRFQNPVEEDHLRDFLLPESTRRHDQLSFWEVLVETHGWKRANSLLCASGFGVMQGLLNLLSGEKSNMHVIQEQAHDVSLQLLKGIGSGAKECALAYHQKPKQVCAVRFDPCCKFVHPK